MMQLRPYEGTDYPMLLEWWNGHHVPAVPLGCLPALGMVAMVDDVPTFAAWVSMDNSCGLCALVWPVSCPISPARDVHSCIHPTLTHLQNLAAGFGYHTMLGITHSDSLSRQLRKRGFSVDDAPIRLHTIHL